MKHELLNSWGGENMLTSLELPWSWEGAEQLLGAFQSESGGDELFLLYDGGLADQKLIDVQQ